MTPTDQIEAQGVEYASATCDGPHGCVLTGTGPMIFAPVGAGGKLLERGITVLGHRPAYLERAAELGARYLKVPDHIWERWSDAERWAANQRFLDRAIARGDEFVLATKAGAARAGSFFARELEYLASKGYRVAEDGWRLIAPGK